MTGNADPNLGEVKVRLGDREYTLTPSLGACMSLSKNNGIVGAITRCRNLEMETIVEVLAAGLGRRSRDLPELVYQAGAIKVMPACITFLSNLSNGGRPLREEDEKTDEGPTGTGSA